MTRPDEALADAPQPERPGTLLLNATIAAILGGALTVLVHELIHLVAGLVLGYPGTLYPFAVEHHNDPGAGQRPVMALSAPIGSLIIGAIATAWLPLRRRGGFGHLLWLWFGFTSLMEGVGYLENTPFGAGDTASAAKDLGWPVVAQVVLCLVGVALRFWAARRFAPHVGRHAGLEKRHTWPFAFYPWILGTLANWGLAALYLAVAHAAVSGGEIAAILAAGTALMLFGPMSFIFRRRFDPTLEPLGLSPVPVGGLVALVATVALNVALCFGLRIG